MNSIQNRERDWEKTRPLVAGVGGLCNAERKVCCWILRPDREWPNRGEPGVAEDILGNTLFQGLDYSAISRSSNTRDESTIGGYVEMHIPLTTAYLSGCARNLWRILFERNW